MKGFDDFRKRFLPWVTGFSLWTNKGPFIIPLMAPGLIFLNPVRTTISPKEEENRESLAREIFEFVN